ncbi:MAG: nicotinate (nicotinamide) nucleotide adenylyltransferase [Caldisericia bacterium]
MALRGLCLSRIGILGGSFNPPTYAHLQLGIFAKDQFSLDKILVVPCSIFGFYKDSKPIAEFHRFNMCILAISSLDGFEVSDVELFGDRPIFAFEGIEKLKRIHKDSEFFYITGSDSIVTLPKWKNPEMVAGNAEFIVAERGDVSFENAKAAIDSVPVKTNSHKLDYPLNSISSTLVRKRLNEGLICNCLTPSSVLEYIKLNDLYI